jgi:hypothetical protein
MLRSCRPRTGSRSRPPISTSSAVGTAKAKNGARHPKRSAM